MAMLAYSSSTSFINKFPNSKISCQNYPLASKIIVKNLPFSTSESSLVQEFSKYGEIAEVRLVKDETRQKSKGFAFIQYTSQDAALLALESMDYQFEERQVFVELAKPGIMILVDISKPQVPLKNEARKVKMVLMSKILLFIFILQGYNLADILQLQMYIKYYW